MAGNGNGSGFRAGLTEWTGSTVAVILTLAFAGGYVIGLVRPVPGANGVDGQMLKEVLLSVISFVLGAAAVKRGVESGATAALSPPPTPASAPPGQGSGS